MPTAAIVQARMGSSRLPGKVMAELAGRPVLAHVLERAKQIKGVDVVCVAAPDTAMDRSIAACALDYGIHTYFGSETDVLDRYLHAAVWIEPLVNAKLDAIIRITADCPLLDPEVCGKVLELHRSEKAEYASNVWPRSFPKGLDCEVFTFDSLLRASQCSVDDHDREHVTPWLVRNCPRVNLASGRFDLAGHRWTLDYPEDLAFLRAVHAVREPQSMADVLAILQEHPDIERINKQCAA